MGTKIVDFSVYHHSRFALVLSELDPSKREEAVWTQVDPVFSEPTTPADNAADYVPAQVIAERFKNEGFDGIADKSAFGEKGYNIVLFDPADAELTSYALFEAESLKFRFEQSDNPDCPESALADFCRGSTEGTTRPCVCKVRRGMARDSSRLGIARVYSDVNDGWSKKGSSGARGLIVDRRVRASGRERQLLFGTSHGTHGFPQ